MNQIADTRSQHMRATASRFGGRPIRVCMHVDAPLKEDPRVMRDVLALAAAGEILRDSYRSRLRQQQEEGAAGQIVALRDALSPIAEAIAGLLMAGERSQAR